MLKDRYVDATRASQNSLLRKLVAVKLQIVALEGADEEWGDKGRGGGAICLRPSSKY